MVVLSYVLALSIGGAVSIIGLHTTNSVLEKVVKSELVEFMIWIVLYAFWLFTGVAVSLVLVSVIGTILTLLGVI